MTCFKYHYQVYLYGKETFTCLKLILLFGYITFTCLRLVSMYGYIAIPSIYCLQNECAAVHFFRLSLVICEKSPNLVSVQEEI